MKDLIGIGELLIDFTPCRTPEGLMFKQNAGGAPCNMLTMAQTLGSKTAFIGKVGDDNFGKFLKNVLEEKSVGTEGLTLSKTDNTTLAFVHLDEGGERSFSFYRKGCADVMLEPSDIHYDLISRAKALHFGSLSFTNEPSKTAVLEAVRFAKDKGLLITYDPNYRPALWVNESTAIEGMLLGVEYADILKVSDEEALLITGEVTIEAAAKTFFDGGVQLVCVTLGDQGAYYHHSAGAGIVKGFRSKVVDTTGAGDAFFGSLVHQVIQSGKSIEALTISDLEGYITYSNAVASLCIEGLGGIPSMPSIEKIEARLKADGIEVCR